MVCPECGAEFREGVRRCFDCDAELVEGPLPEPVADWVEMVPVFETGDPSTVMVARSLLDDAGIAYFADGDQLQDLIGIGRFGTGFNILAGAVRFRVAPEDAEDARRLLSDLEPSGREGDG